jgi:hypothetical protein
MKKSGLNIIMIALFGLAAANIAFAGFSSILNGTPPDSARNEADTVIHSDSATITGQEVVPSATENAPKANSGKNRWPTGALLRSVVVPGWGQAYNHNYIKAVIYGGTEIALITTTRKYWREMNSHQRNFLGSADTSYKASEFRQYESSRNDRNLYLWLTGLTVLISMFDAYVDAHLADFDQTDKAFEVFVAPRKDQVQLSIVYNFK